MFAVLLGAALILVSASAPGAEEVNGPKASATPFAGDAVLGKQIVFEGTKSGAAACVACHGQNGEGQAAGGFPQLAGLDAGYILKQLREYRKGVRANPIMLPIASALTDEDMANVARYFASLPPVASYVAEDEKVKVLELGREIAQNGLWKKGVPACYACHGPHGAGVGANFPRISFQHKAYIVQQLKAWKSGERKNDPLGLMKTVSQKLSASEIEAVASFLNSQQKLSSKKEDSK